jgi:hypothetical protein
MAGRFRTTDASVLFRAKQRRKETLLWGGSFGPPLPVSGPSKLLISSSWSSRPFSLDLRLTSLRDCSS